MAERGRSYCAAHARRTSWITTTSSSSSRGYGYSWQQLRAYVLRRDPVCAMCGIRPSTDCDHITPKSRGGTDALDNLQGLCRECHAVKTARDRRSKR